MIVFVKVSARRYFALDCPTVPSGWRGTAATPRDAGYVYGFADIIAGPADWSTVEAAAAAFARSEGAMWTAAEWEAEQKVRSEALKTANMKIQEQKVRAEALTVANAEIQAARKARTR